MEMSPSLRCDAPHPKLNFRELRAYELRRILLLSTWVNKGMKKGRSPILDPDTSPKLL